MGTARSARADLVLPGQSRLSDGRRGAVLPLFRRTARRHAAAELLQPAAPRSGVAPGVAQQRDRTGRALPAAALAARGSCIAAVSAHTRHLAPPPVGLGRAPRFEE